MIPEFHVSLYSGQSFNLSNPKSCLNRICIEDIGHSLSLQCRFVGQCKKFYSVAQHSVLLSELVSPDLALWALLHDATETYLGDISSPLKSMIPEFSSLELRFRLLIAVRFCLPTFSPLVYPVEVDAADKFLFMSEWSQLVDKQLEGLVYAKETHGIFDFATVSLWTPEEAEYRFLSKFFELSKLTGSKDENS